MSAPIRVVHYVNQFFAGIGGEEKAESPVGLKAGALGPARGLQQQLGGRGQVVATVYCGDDYFHQRREEAEASILEHVRSLRPDVLVAGPAFESGRYGLACVEVGQAVSSALGIPCVLAMSPQNPAKGTYEGYKNLKVWALPTTESAAGMPDALRRLARFVERVASGQEIGPAQEEGYIARGVRLPADADRSGADRAIGMILAKLKGRPFATEIPIETPDRVAPAPPVRDLASAKIAVVTTSGVVPKGNPDAIPFSHNDRWGKYNVDGLRSMQERQWEVQHSGYHTAFMLENPNFSVPLDVLREMEDAGAFGSLHSEYFATNNSATVARDQAMGREMGAQLKAAGVDGVLLVST